MSWSQETELWRLASRMSSPGLASKVFEWMAGEETGLSSMSMACAALGIKEDRADHPHDTGDLSRCLMLVELIPEIRDHFPTIAALSAEWKALIDNWDELAALAADDVGKVCGSRRTYKRMRELLDAKATSPT